MDSPFSGRWLAGLVGIGLLLLPVSVSADTPANCGNLQTVLNNATPGDTIALSGTCPNSSFNFVSGHVPVTLKAAAAGAGFNGGAADTPILTGNNIGATTISGLTFRNGNLTAATNGAAIHVEGDSAPTIDGNVFLGNKATAALGAGGAVSVAVTTSGTTRVSGNTFGSATEGNQAGEFGGGLLVNTNGAIVVTGNSFVGNQAGALAGGAGLNANGSATVTDNVFQANTVTAAGGSLVLGGGLLISLNQPLASYEVRHNTFLANRIEGAGTQDRQGGGLALLTQSPSATTVTQADNVFDGNLISSAPGGEAGGAGEWISATKVISTHDVFTSNTIDHAGGEGGGVGVEGVDQGMGNFLAGELHAVNLVADGNRLASGGLGGGIYAGGALTCAPAPDCPSVLELTDSTVAGNCIASAGTGPGIGGSADDQLTVRNSIVHNSGGESPCGAAAVSTPDIGGFAPANVAVTFSDACASGSGTGAPLAGAGNICADPLIANARLGDFHQSATSPTIDVGSNALVPPTLTTDANGAPRIQDGNGDGTAVVDMGADERPRPAATGGTGASDTTRPILGILRQVLRADRRGRVRVRVKCTEQTRCIGRLTLTSVAKVAAKRKARRLKLGSARFNIAGGKTARVTVKLSRKAFAVLKRKHSLRVVVSVTGRDVAGNAAKAAKRTLTLKAPPRKRSRR